MKKVYITPNTECLKLNVEGAMLQASVDLSSGNVTNATQAGTNPSGDGEADAKAINDFINTLW